MRLIRFIDHDGIMQYGQDYDPEAGTATLIAGDPLEDGTATEQSVRVHKLLAPVDPRAILCIGLNYRGHAEETDEPVPTKPVLFIKNPGALQNPGDAILLPKVATAPEVDYEVELAVVIGRTAKNVSREQALDYVFGYTVANDVSARQWQKHGSGGQWGRGKSFDTFCPLGPELVTADEVDDPQNLNLRTLLNGEVMQEANTADMIFSVADLIADLSRDMTLLRSTVLLTGTPSGVGVARDPQVFLKAGDTVTVEIDGIGSLTNPVADA